MPHRRSRRARATLSLVALSMLASCAGDETADTGAEPPGTVVVATLPPVATTAVPTTAAPAPSATASASVAPTTEVPATAATTSTTRVVTSSTGTSSTGTSSTGTASTTTAPRVPCDLDLIVEQTQTVYEGITPSDLACADGWAAWIGRPDDQFADGFFAVARWGGNSWELMNLGTAGVCADAGVPDAIWDELGCFE